MNYNFKTGNQFATKPIELHETETVAFKLTKTEKAAWKKAAGKIPLSKYIKKIVREQFNA